MIEDGEARDPESIRWVVSYGLHQAGTNEFVGTSAAIEGLNRLKQNPYGANACDGYGTKRTFDTAEQIRAFAGSLTTSAKDYR